LYLRNFDIRRLIFLQLIKQIAAEDEYGSPQRSCHAFLIDYYQRKRPMYWGGKHH
jgi:hypothetical protein